MHKRFNATDRLAHHRPSPDALASASAQLAKPAYCLSDDAERFRDMAHMLLKWGTALTNEILQMRHERGFRDRDTMDAQEIDGELYRAATGENWLARARGAGL